ncbi:hypothetical protein [Luteolibacter soli]|uniref:Uncharacterized protein n=1 Tax=Luteolibacter soli TaxID=3135280 RepID=A0ABU9AZX2_9BACT
MWAGRPPDGAVVTSVACAFMPEGQGDDLCGIVVSKKALSAALRQVTHIMEVSVVYTVGFEGIIEVAGRRIAVFRIIRPWRKVTPA